MKLDVVALCHAQALREDSEPQCAVYVAQRERLAALNAGTATDYQPSDPYLRARMECACHPAALWGVLVTLRGCRILAKECGLPSKLAAEIQKALVTDARAFMRKHYLAVTTKAERATHNWCSRQAKALVNEAVRLRNLNGAGYSTVQVKPGKWGVTHSMSKGEQYSSRCHYRKNNVHYAVVMPRSWRVLKIGSLPTAVPYGFRDRDKPVMCRRLLKGNGVKLEWGACWVYRDYHSDESPEDAVEQYGNAVRERWARRHMKHAKANALLTVDMAVAAGVGCRPGCQAFAERLGARWGVPVIDCAPADWALDQAERMGEHDSIARLRRYLNP